MVTSALEISDLLANEDFWKEGNAYFTFTFNDYGDKTFSVWLANWKTKVAEKISLNAFNEFCLIHTVKCFKIGNREMDFLYSA